MWGLVGSSGVSIQSMSLLLCDHCNLQYEAGTETKLLPCKSTFPPKPLLTAPDTNRTPDTNRVTAVFLPRPQHWHWKPRGSLSRSCELTGNGTPPLILCGRHSLALVCPQTTPTFLYNDPHLVCVCVCEYHLQSLSPPSPRSGTTMWSRPDQPEDVLSWTSGIGSGMGPWHRLVEKSQSGVR